MIADQPLVVYPKSNEKDKPITKKSADDFYDRWKAKKDAIGKNAHKGEKISLGDYLNNRI